MNTIIEILLKIIQIIFILYLINFLFVVFKNFNKQKNNKKTLGEQLINSIGGAVYIVGGNTIEFFYRIFHNIPQNEY